MIEYTTNSVSVEDHRILLTLWNKLLTLFKYLLWGIGLIILSAGLIILVLYWLRDRSEESRVSEKSLLIGSSRGEHDLLRSYAAKTMQLFDQEDGGIDIVEEMVKQSRKNRKSGSHTSVNVCKFCGYKNSRNAIYCFNCNGVIGRPIL